MKAQDFEGSGVARRARRWTAGLLLVLMMSVPGRAAVAEDYQPSEAGSPLRILGYVVYPVGVVLDYLILRPAYWVGSHEPFRTIFGRDA